MKHIFAIVTALLLFMPSFSFAEEKKIIEWTRGTFTGTFTMGDNDTRKGAESTARSEAMRKAAEWVWVFVESETSVNNLQLTKDEIRTTSRSLFQSEDVGDPKWSPDGRTVTVTISAKYDKVKNEKILQGFIENEQLKLQAKDQKIIKKKMSDDNNDLTKQVKELNKKFANTPIESERERIKAEILENKRLIDENQDVSYWFDKGYYHSLRHEDIEAIEAYNKAIAINPNLAFAYNNSGVVYFNKGEYNIAIQDYNKAIAIDPKLAVVYRNRGEAYAAKGQYDKAVEDYNKVLTIDPDYARDMRTRLRLEDAKKWRDIQDRTQGILIDTLQRACKYGDTLSCEELKKHAK